MPLSVRADYEQNKLGTCHLVSMHVMELKRILPGGWQVRRFLRMGVRDIIDRVGVTSILVTHDQEEAFDIADHVIIFNR